MNTLDPLIHALADRRQRLGARWDRWRLCWLAALEETRDPQGSVALADRALEEMGGPVAMSAGFTTDGTPVHREAAEWDEDVFAHAHPSDSLGDTPPVRQLDTWSCGAASSAAVGLLRGVGPDTLDGWKKLLGTNDDTKESSGTPPEHIIGAFRSFGCPVEAREGMTPGDLRGYVQRGWPVIVPIQEWGSEREKAADRSGHYVVIIGAEDDGSLLIQDPSLDNALHDQGGDQEPGRMLMSPERLLEVWHDKAADGRQLVRYGIAVGPAEGAVAMSTLSQRVEAAAWRTDTDPSPGRRESGNYRKGRVSFHGLPVAIEVPQGEYRQGVGRDGKPWKTRMAAHYGYICGTKGADDEACDVFLGPHADSHLVYVIDQVDPDTGRFDEHKAVLGTMNEDQARRTYLACYKPGWKGLGAIRGMTLPQFKTWLEAGNGRKPVGKLKSIAMSAAPEPPAG